MHWFLLFIYNEAIDQQQRDKPVAADACHKIIVLEMQLMHGDIMQKLKKEEYLTWLPPVACLCVQRLSKTLCVMG